MYFPKATILALYFELFPTTMPKLRTMLYIVTAFTVASGLTTCMLDTFYCPHVPDNWSTEEGVCSVFNSLLVLQIDWAMNFSSDLFGEFLSCLLRETSAYIASLCTPVSLTACSHTSTRTKIRSHPHLHARPLDHRRQPSPLRHNSTRNRLEWSLRVVHGGDERRNHGRVDASAQVSSQILEDIVKIG